MTLERRKPLPVLIRTLEEHADAQRYLDERRSASV